MRATPASAAMAFLACTLPACSGHLSTLIYEQDAGAPAEICAGAALQGGPAAAPAGAVVVPAGDNSATELGTAGATFWFAPGVHTLGPDLYGQIIPGDGATYIGAPGAVLDGRGVNAYAFTQHASGVHVAYLEICNFIAPGNEGVVNHDGGVNWIMEHLYVHDNGGAGVFVSSGNVLRDSCLRGNAQYGLQGMGPGGGGSAVGVLVDHNEISGNGTGLADHSGAGAKLWDVDGATITSNWIHDNAGMGIMADGNDRSFVIEDNTIENSWAEAIAYAQSYNAQIRRNLLRRNALGKGAAFAARGDSYPVAAIYIAGAGGDARVAGVPTLEIGDNTFEDNWGGVTLWEDPDLFCGSPTSPTGFCTLVNPAATTATCIQPGIATAPLRDDCRWKTQNVTIHDNAFDVTPSAIGCSSTLCARQAIISKVGSTPTWSPYLGSGVEDAITFSQGNLFRDNHYSGPWRFVAHDTSVDLDFAAWQAAPYGQDPGSSPP